MDDRMENIGKNNSNTQRRRAWNTALLVLSVLIAAALGYSIYRVADVLREYEAGEDVYAAMDNEYYSISTPAPDGVIDVAVPDVSPREDTVNEGGAAASGDYSISPLNADMDMLKSLNGDSVGFLYSPGTRICYPVVQGDDNSYYLNHLIDKKHNRNGTLFIDCNNSPDFSDKNTVIYGHNMKSGAMFASINSYRRQSYYDEHPVMYLTTLTGKYTVQLFAGYPTTVADQCYRLNFGDSEAYAAFLAGAVEKSNFTTGVQVEVTDRIITLSTCTSSSEGTHYVLLGKLVDAE